MYTHPCISTIVRTLIGMMYYPAPDPNPNHPNQPLILTLTIQTNPLILTLTSHLTPRP